jgi:GIY-YIG catalytic domain
MSAMRVDNCPHSFDELAVKILPSLMKRLKLAMENPTPLANFLVNGHGVMTLLKQHNRKCDFSGCYVLIEERKPIYVGISRKVFDRLKHHCKGDNHNEATFAYSIAKKTFFCDLPTRAQRMQNKGFLEHFHIAKSRIQSCSFAFVEIENPLVLYVFEAYCALSFETGEWNTFRTH